MLKHMSRVTRNCYMITALYQLNKDDIESNIIMNRLYHLFYIEIANNSHGVYVFFVKLEHIFQDSYP